MVIMWANALGVKTNISNVQKHQSQTNNSYTSNTRSHKPKTSSSQSTQTRIQGNLSFLQQLRNGEFGLAKTYWLYGFVVGMIVNIFVRIIKENFGFGYTLIVELPFFIYLLHYELNGVWKAAGKYKGPKIWAILAKVIVFSNVIGIAAVIVIYLDYFTS